jgi:uncharacterized membrane protein YecN with MAPEG domain
MPTLPVTAATTGLLGFLFVFLAVRVIMARGKTGVSLGDGGGSMIAAGHESAAPLLVACRAHANFAEYVPFALIVLGLVEMSHAAQWFVCLLASMLLVARVAHPIGMGRKIPNPFRAGGLVFTVLTIVIGCGYLLVQVGRSYLG